MSGMRPADRDLLQRTLRHLEAQGALPPVDWDLLVRQGRHAGLLARLAARLEELGLGAAVPVQVALHLSGERSLAAKHARDVRWEIEQIKAALRRIEVPVVFLKGAAYILADLPPARGRLFSDVDIMVPRERLDEVEAALRGAGWHPGEIDPRDERYYRDWMHQIPPMTHLARGTTIDVHHTIVARTTQLELHAQKLFARAVPAAIDPEVRILAPADMVLHSAVHLLNGGDYARGARDLDDLNRLLRHFAAPSFWPELLARAAELDLRRPLFYALRYTARFCGTPVPDEVRNAPALRPPAAPLRLLMDALFTRALRPNHPSCRDAFSAGALLLLYLRAHYLLMPLRLLVPHLVRKSLMAMREAPDPRAPLRKPH